MSDTVYFVMEVIGTVAFSVSGAIIAIQKGMDILGVVILGVTTAVGGGAVRDLLLGCTPPTVFIKPVYFILAAIIAIIVFIPAVRMSIEKSVYFDKLLLFMDSVGLGVFTVVGIKAGCNVSDDFNAFLLIFVGVITGVGGGVLRDIFAQELPAIFRRHFYACASIIGAGVCVSLWNFAGESLAMLSAMACIIILRLMAAHFKWELPKAKSANPEQ